MATRSAAASRYEASLRGVPPLDLGQFLSHLQTNALGTREIDALRANGGELDSPHRAVIGWQSLVQRDLTAVGAPALQDTTTTPAEAALRAASVVVASGARVAQTRAGLLVPKVSTAISAEWLADEASSITETQPTIGALALNPHWVGTYIQVSRQLLLQGTAVSEAISAELLGAVGAAIDEGFLQGSGSGGEPQGLANISGIGTASGGTLSLAACATAVQTLLASGAREASLGWITTPAVATVLRTREKASGSGFLMGDDGTLLGHPVRVSSNAPTGVLLLADWSRILVATFGDGLRVESDPYSAGFSAGIVGMRLLAAVDIAPMYASMIYTLTGVS